MTYRESLIKRISDIPASLCPDTFYRFTKRGEGMTKIEWDMDLLIDQGVPIRSLMELANIVENRFEGTTSIHIIR